MSRFAQPKNSQELLAQLSAHGPALLAVILVIAIGIQSGLIVTGNGTHAPGAGAAAAAHTRNAARPLDLAVIRNLFKAPAKSNGSDAPETSAPLVLAGVLAVDDPERGMAILGPTAASAKLYPAGADVPGGGVRLHAIYRDHVLLERNGVLETLYLPRLSGGAAPAAPVVSNVLPPGQRLQNFARNNGGLLNGLIRIQPVFNSGKLSGYRLFPGTGGVPGMTRLGLKAGDLVTAVNGTALDDPNHANEVLQSLANASSATVTISRNGVEEEVNLNLENVASEAEAAAEAAAANAPPDNGNAGPGGRFGGFGRPGPGHSPSQATYGTEASASGDTSAAPEGAQGSASAAPPTSASQ